MKIFLFTKSAFMSILMQAFLFLGVHAINRNCEWANNWCWMTASAQSLSHIQPLVSEVEKNENALQPFEKELLAFFKELKDQTKFATKADPQKLFCLRDQLKPWGLAQRAIDDDYEQELFVPILLNYLLNNSCKAIKNKFIVTYEEDAEEKKELFFHFSQFDAQNTLEADLKGIKESSEFLVISLGTQKQFDGTLDLDSDIPEDYKIPHSLGLLGKTYQLIVVGAAVTWSKKISGGEEGHDCTYAQDTNGTWYLYDDYYSSSKADASPEKFDTFQNGSFPARIVKPGGTYRPTLLIYQQENELQTKLFTLQKNLELLRAKLAQLHAQLDQLKQQLMITQTS